MREKRDRKVRLEATRKSTNSIKAKAFGRLIDRMLKEKYGNRKEEEK